MADWSLRSVQASWFTARFAELNPPKIFERLTAAEPDTFQRNPAGAPRGLSFAIGVVGNCRYQVAVSPGRLDVICADASEGDVDTEYVGLPITETIAQFYDQVGKSHPFVESASRLSSVVTLRLPADTEAAAADKLWELVAPAVHVADASDFIFQVNSVRSYGDVKYNRIAKYQSERVQGMMLQLEVPGGVAIPTGVPAYYSSVQFDINTVPDGTDFNVDRQISTFRQLTHLQLEAVKDLRLGAFQK